MASSGLFYEPKLIDEGFIGTKGFRKGGGGGGGGGGWCFMGEMWVWQGG